MLPIYVPAHVHYAPKVEHHILVESGSNWDLASVALVTPVVELRNPQPIIAPNRSVENKTTAVSPGAIEPATTSVQSAPHTKAVSRLRIPVSFVKHTAALPKDEKRRLLELPKETPLFIASVRKDSTKRDSDLCRTRISVIASMLRAYGYHVTELHKSCSDAVSSGNGTGGIAVFNYNPMLHKQ